MGLANIVGCQNQQLQKKADVRPKKQENIKSI